VGFSAAQPTASIAKAVTSAAATVRTASVLLLRFVLIGAVAFPGLVHKCGAATASLADAIAVIALAGSFHRIGRRKVLVRRRFRNELALLPLGV
jgi:hypothetical protein